MTRLLSLAVTPCQVAREYPLFTPFCFLILSFSLTVPSAESKVIQIQSDHLLAASPPVAAMKRSKVTFYPSLLKKTWTLLLDFLLVGFLIFFLIFDAAALLYKQPPTFVID